MRGDIEPLVYGRIILVGWGTVVGSVFAFVMIDSIIWQDDLARFLVLDLALWMLNCIWIGTALSVILLIPMSMVWMPVYAIIRGYIASIRTASTLAAAVTVAAAVILTVLYFGLKSGSAGSVIKAVMPWSLVPVAIAASLTWFAFRSEQFAGGR